jgi:hypothetical protein
MTDLWMPGAIKADVGDHAPTDKQYPAKAVAHITWDRNASAAKPADLVPFSDLKNYFTGSGKGMAPHILWNPFTGEFAQFYPADSRSKSVVDLAGGTRTNRAGRVVIQIEALFFPNCRVDGKVYPRLVDTPCKGWDELHAWVRSWGVPDVWPNGRPENCTRNEHNWETEAGWYPHKGVPENDHEDPLSWPAFPATPKPPVNKPVVSLVHLLEARRKDIPAPTGHTTHKAEVLLVEQALHTLGLLAKQYVDGSWGTKTDDAYNAYRRRKGYTGSAAEGDPGIESLTKLAKDARTFTAAH